MNPPSLVLFSTQLEAESALARFHAKASSSISGLFHSDLGDIAISGMGPFKSILFLSKIPTYQSIYSVGVAGSLSDKMEIGTICSPTDFSFYHPYFDTLKEHSRSFFSKQYPQLCIGKSKGLHMLCSFFPLHEASEKQKLSKEFQLIDMESYAQAFYCYEQGVNFHCLKVISDNPSQSGEKGSIPQRIKDQLSSQLADLLANAIEKKACKVKLASTQPILASANIE